MKKHFLLACLLMAMGGVCPDIVNAQCGDNGDGTFSNPVFWADVPDPDVIRVGDDYNHAFGSGSADYALKRFGQLGNSKLSV